MRLTIDIADKDYNFFVTLFDRMGASFQHEMNTEERQLREDKITNTIKRGGDFSYLGDTDLNFKNDDEKTKWAMNYFSDNPSFDNVLEWQKNERKERKLPFRDE